MRVKSLQKKILQNDKKRFVIITRNYLENLQLF